MMKTTTTTLSAAILQLSLLSLLCCFTATNAYVVVQPRTAVAANSRSAHIPAARSAASSSSKTRLQVSATSTSPPTTETTETDADTISADRPLHVMISGAGVGGLVLAKDLLKHPEVKVTVIEQTSEFKRFGGPIQLASNALQILKEMDTDTDIPVYDKISAAFTTTGDKMNGIKDGIRTEWYAKFDLQSPAVDRDMPLTGVIERPTLQEIYLDALPHGVVHNGDGVASYERNAQGGLTVTTQSGKTYDGDLLIGADGIWSQVRSTMTQQPARGDDSGVAYSGYTLFAGELEYDSADHGEVGYKVYIGPGQYFVVTDIGNGRYQWYAFLGKPPGTAKTEVRPDGISPYLQTVFEGWSHEIHHILKATQEHEIEQRDLYDRPPDGGNWVDNDGTGRVALLGDGIHAMMPNLGQGGCQAIEDAYVLSQELANCDRRSTIVDKLQNYQRRRYIRAAAVQGLSRFASDIIIRGFDTPAKIVRDEETGAIRFENFNYAGIVTKMLQPILPIFFSVQFNFLYDGWRNEIAIDLPAAVATLGLGSLVLLLLGGSIGEAGLVAGVGVDALFGTEGLLDFDAILQAVQDFF